MHVWATIYLALWALWGGVCLHTVDQAGLGRASWALPWVLFGVLGWIAFVGPLK